MPRSNTPDRGPAARAGAASTGMPAPYGRACLNCSRAKCRCIYRLDGAGCERCYRLKKDCQPTVPVRKRGSASKKSSSLSRTAQLERKLDGLVSLLTAHGGAIGSAADRGSSVDSCEATSRETSLPAMSGAATPTATSMSMGLPPSAALKPLPGAAAAVAAAAAYLPRTPESTSPTAPARTAAPLPTTITATDLENHRNEEIAMSLCGFDNNPVPLTTPVPAAGSNTVQLDPAIEPSAAEAEASLATFRAEMLPYLPFAYLPPDLTAAQLRRERPLFWLAIISVINKRSTLEVQTARSLQLRTIFAQRAVIECEKSIDLLLAILTFIVWLHFAARRDRPILSLFSQMAVSLVYDLGLHKTVIPCKSLLARFMRGGHVVVDDVVPETLGLEERRAALGCYIMSSIISIYLKRSDSLHWSNRMEEHVQTLLANPETPLDHVLVAQVRLQRIADHIYAGEWQLSDPVVNTCNVAPLEQRSLFGPRVLPLFIARILCGKIDLTMSAVPESLRNHDGIRAHLLSLEIILHASTVPMPTPGQPAAAKTTESSIYADYASQATLVHCVQAINNFWAFHHAIPSATYSFLPFTYFFYYASCVTLLRSLAQMDSATWDNPAIPQPPNLFEVLDHFIEKLNNAPQVRQAASSDPEYWNIFQRTTAIVASLRDRWAAELQREMGALRDESSANCGNGSGGSDGSGNNANNNDNSSSSNDSGSSADNNNSGSNDPICTANEKVSFAAAGISPANNIPATLASHALPPSWCMTQPVGEEAPVVDMSQPHAQLQPPPPHPLSDPTMMLGSNLFFTEFFQAMGVTEDPPLYDVFYPHDSLTGQMVYP